MGIVTPRACLQLFCCWYCLSVMLLPVPSHVGGSSMQTAEAQTQAENLSHLQDGEQFAAILPHDLTCLCF